MPLPGLLFSNAYTGRLDDGSALHPNAGKWIGAGIEVPPKPMSGRAPLAAVADLKQWADPDVGWGLVLPDDPTLTVEQRATADDAPEPIRRLLQHRKGVVLRWSAELPIRKIRRYYATGAVNDPDVAGAPRGPAPGPNPRDLLM